MTLAVVQHTSRVGGGNQVPTNITLPSPPTLGNVVVVFLGCNVGTGGMTVANGWKMFSCAETDTNAAVVIGLYRYVQSGDTSTTPNFFSAGSTYWTAQAYEISGVSGSWDADFISAQYIYTSGSSITIPNTRVTMANSLVLVGYAQYNGNGTPTISSGGWTNDEANSNFANYGAYGSGHQSVSTADTILSGSITFAGSSGPAGALVLVLTPTTPNKATIRQVKSYSGNGTPGAPVFYSTPKNGSLILAFLHWSNGTQVAPTINSSGWSQFATALNGSNPQLIGLERYAGASEPVTQPVIATAGSQFWALTVMEICGLAGSWGTDFHSVVTGRQASGASMSTTISSSSGDTLALISAGNYDGNAAMGISSGWNLYGNSVDFSNYGSWLIAEQHYPSGGSITGTITEAASSQPAAYMQVLLGGGPAISAVVCTQLGYEVWLQGDTAVEVTQAGFEVWATVQSKVKVSQMIAEVWSSNQSKVKISQANIELWRSVVGTNTQVIASQIGFEVWEGFTHVAPPSFKKTVIIILNGG